MIVGLVNRLPARLGSRWGMSWTLALGVGLVIGVLMTVTSVLEIKQERADGIDKLQDQAIRLVKGVNDLVADSLYMSDIDRLDDLASVLTGQSEIRYVRISRSDGRLVVDSDQADYPLGAVAERPVRVTVSERLETSRPREHTLEVSAPILMGDEVLGKMEIGFNTDSVEAEFRSAVFQEIWRSLTLFAAGIGAAFLIGQYFVRPIRTLVAATRSVAAGDFRDSGLATRGDEIGELASSFDRMSKRLKDSHEDLEHQVSERTGQLRASEHRARQLTRQLVEVQESERRNIARDLHDELGQDLTALKFRLEAVGNSHDGLRSDGQDEVKLVEELIEKVRDLSLSLRPSMLDDLGLLPALNWLVQHLRDQGDIRVEFEHDGVQEDLNPSLRTVAYRIVQEGLTNVSRHAGARRVSLSVTAGGGKVRILIEDDGVGFEPETALATGNTVGLHAMRERVDLLSGRLAVDSAPGEGTRLSAELPLNPTRSEK